MARFDGLLVIYNLIFRLSFFQSIQSIHSFYSPQLTLTLYIFYIIFAENSWQKQCKKLGSRCSLGARGTLLSLRAGAVGAALGGGLGGVEGARAGLEPTAVGEGDALHGLVHLLGLLGLLGRLDWLLATLTLR